MIKVSVVLPVYNVENYLRECLDSILNQTLTDIEVICINDGSTDRSLDILKEYAAKDQRVIVMDNERKMGAAESRNAGIRLARGEYLAILDADDFCHRRMLEIAYTNCAEADADIGTYDYAKFDHQSKNAIVYSMPLFFAKKIGRHIFDFAELPEQIFQLVSCAPWNKIFKRKFVLDSGIEFQNLPNSNDTYFGYMILTKARRIHYIDTPEPLYYYRFNTPSQTTSHVYRHPDSTFKALGAMRETLLAQGEFERYRRSFYSRVIDNIYYMLDKAKGLPAAELLELVYEEGLRPLQMLDCQENDFLSKYQFNRYQYLLHKGEGDMQPFSALSIEEMFRFLSNTGFKFGLWGYGLFGKAFYQASKEHGFELTSIIDEDRNKTGMQVDRLKIEPFTEAAEKVDAVIVTNSFYGKSILKRIKQSGSKTKLIDLDGYLRFGLRLEDCIF